MKNVTDNKCKFLNADYLYLTIRSIINKCGDDFHVALIDDNSFKMVLDNWTIDLNLLESVKN